MSTVTTLLLGVGIGLALSALLRRNAVVRAPQEPGQPFLATGQAPAPAGNAKVTIISGTSNKIQDIKAIRACSKLGLKDAKDAVDNYPTQLVSGISEEHARWMQQQLQAAGLTVTVS